MDSEQNDLQVDSEHGDAYSKQDDIQDLAYNRQDDIQADSEQLDIQVDSEQNDIQVDSEQDDAYSKQDDIQVDSE